MEEVNKTVAEAEELYKLFKDTGEEEYLESAINKWRELSKLLGFDDVI